MGNRLGQYVEDGGQNSAPAFLLVIVPIVFFCALMLTPRDWRLAGAIGFALFWMTVSQLLSLGTIQAVAKTTVPVMFALVAFAGYIDHNNKRQLAASALLFPAIAFFSIFFILRVDGAIFAIFIRCLYVMLVVTAVLVVRTVTTADQLDRIMKALTFFAVLSLWLCAASLIFDRAGSFFGNRRFTPWRANPNQIGMMFIMGFTFCMYTAFRSPSVIWKVITVASAGLSFGMGIITASRSIVFAILLLAVPFAFALTKKPAILVLVGIFSLPAPFIVMNMAAQEYDFGRLGTTETTRGEIWSAYAEVIMDAPLVGLLHNEGGDFLQSRTVGQHPHNAYLYAFYYGGFAYGIPVLLVTFLAFVATLHVWFSRKQTGTDPLLITALASLMMMMFLQGMANGALHYPTYFWAFLHVILAMMFMSWSSDLRLRRPPLYNPHQTGYQGVMI